MLYDHVVVVNDASNRQKFRQLPLSNGNFALFGFGLKKAAVLLSLPPFTSSWHVTNLCSRFKS